MKNFYLLITFLCLLMNGFAQNNPPLAINDTFYVDYNDTLDYTVYSGQTISATGGPNFLTNDTDPDANQIIIDTAFYPGTGTFTINTFSSIPSVYQSDILYTPSLNYFGLDSFQYVIKDNGIPVMYDTAWVYLKVKYNYDYLDLNNIKARISLFELFHDYKNNVADFEVPKRNQPSDPKYNTIFAANLWIAGENQNTIYSNSETYEYVHSNNSDSTFISRCGPIMDSAHYPQEYDYKWDRLWKVNDLDIDYHQNNWNNTGYQAIEVIENWPAHGDTSKGQAFYLAPFVDNNNDGIYNPYDGDYPKIKGQQAIYRITNDMRWQPTINMPMVTEIHCMAYAYKCSSDSALNGTLFIDYTIYNRSNRTYDSTYIGNWTEFDIGNPTDDYLGCDVSRGVFYAYNGDAIDEDANGVNGYQNHPPAQGVMFLKGVPRDPDGTDNPLTTNIAQAVSQGGIPYAGLGDGYGDAIVDNEYRRLEHFTYYNTGSGQFPGDGSPVIPNDYYNYLTSHWRDGAPMVWGGNANAISTGGTVPTDYIFPVDTDPFFWSSHGVSISPVMWSEDGEGNPTGDRRGVGSTGPFTFEPDSSVEITLAYVYGRDHQNTGSMAGITVMKERVDSIGNYYLNSFANVCGEILSVDENNFDENALAVYPNPFNGVFTINYALQTDQAELNIYNVYGQLVREKMLYTSQNSVKIDLSSEAKGIYLIQMVDGNHVITKRIVKQ